MVQWFSTTLAWWNVDGLVWWRGLGITVRWRSKVNILDISSNNDRNMQTGDGDDEEMRPSSIIFLIVYISSDDYKI